MADETPDFNNTLGSFTHTVKSIGTTRTLASVGGSNLQYREKLTIINVSQGSGNRSLFIGDSGVTTNGATQGEELLPGDVWEEFYGEDVEVYIIGNSGTSAFIKESASV